MKPTPPTSAAIDFLNWYLAGYGWVYAAIGIVGAGGVLPRIVPSCVRPTKSAIAIALLGSLCVSLTVYLVLSRLIEVGGWSAFRTVMFGISHRSPTGP